MSLGIDIGKYCIKMVELSKTGEDINVEKIGIFKICEDMKKYNLDNLSKSQISASIQDLTQQLNLKPNKMKNVTTSLSGAHVDVRQLTTLDMPDHELLVSLELEAKKHMPLDGTDAIIDYHHLGSSETELDKINVKVASKTTFKDRCSRSIFLG